MFDIGFWELVVIAVIALIVFGPEEFPTLIRNAARGIAKVRQFVSAVKADMDFEIQRVDELKRMVEQETKLAEMDAVAKELGDSVSVNKPIATPQESREHKHEFDKQRAIEDPAKDHAAGSSHGTRQT